VENMTKHEISSRNNHELIIILLLCITAALRVFLFNAAFPFFNNVDEESHFDLVYKYSHGQIPKASIEDYRRQAIELIILYKTPEYLAEVGQYPDGIVPPPIAEHPNPRETAEFNNLVTMWQLKIKNPEAGSFPVYYTIAGLWCAFGRLLGMDGVSLLYWIRFLNAPLFAVFVWFCYLIGRNCFQNNHLQRIALPLIAAFFPQDVFYTINNDAISPLLFAVSLFMLLQLYLEEKSYAYHFVAGLIVAATFLAKISNIIVLVLFGLITILKLKILSCDKKTNIFRLISLLAATVIPIAVWLTRNQFVLGAITGSSEKIDYLGWTVKPFGQLWSHPILKPSGFVYFIKELTKTFWRGELVWYRTPMALSGMDLFYIVSSIIFIFASGLGLAISWKKAEEHHRTIILISFLTVASSVFVLAVLSMLYDFGECLYPSLEKPYFISGRLISGAILPFLIIYIDGLRQFFFRLKDSLYPLVVVAAVAIIITCSEILLTLDVFKSQYNWFHLK
jgi:hypothetical protein